MSVEEICALPIADIAAKDCVLFLWATFPNLPAAFDVIKAWGFTYKTVAFTWVKTCRKSPGYFVSLGHWTRANAEVCLLATRGHPKRISKSVRQLIVSPLRRHSQKPDEARERIVELMGDLPRVELFAREKIPGWAVWGDEVEPDVALAPL
jgi:N6-adenosine-specific RNA methylase IME4